MSRNARRPAYRNRLSVATLTAITLLCVALAATFVGFVVSRNRLAALADEQRRVEQQIALYQQEIQALHKRIDTSLTRDKVHERLAAAGTYLKPIEPASIIVLPQINLPKAEAVHLPSDPEMAQAHSRAFPSP
jgi:hypothetical protein